MRTLALWVMTALATAGCGGGSDKGDHGAAADLSTSGPDLLPEFDMARTVTTYHYVSDHILLPQSASDYAVDLNGSGKKNKLGSIVSLLIAAEHLDLQGQEDMAIARGEGLFLFSLTTGDPTLMTDADATLAEYTAVKMDPPDFSGAGKFVADKSTKANFDGPIAGGTFVSADPKTLAAPPTLRLNIGLSATVSVSLPVIGARLGFDAATDRLAMGRLGGAIKQSDINATLIPALAKLFNEIAHQDPCTSNCMNVKMTFDVGGCTNPDGSKAAVDGKIDLCEVSGNGLVQSLLSPDVQLFDGSGAWKPNKSNTVPDSLSLGAGFVAVKASFTE